jgi:hypothetical protein
MTDIDNPKQEVEILLKDGKLLVNVDGVCVLRIQNINPDIISIPYDSEINFCAMG